MILLISDLHLQEERPDISRAFLDLLDGRARHAKALYILGDFFEAWIGDDAMTPFQQSICQGHGNGVLEPELVVLRLVLGSALP